MDLCTQEISSESDVAEDLLSFEEAMYRENVREWLDQNGKALFAVEFLLWKKKDEIKQLKMEKALAKAFKQPTKAFVIKK